jgi:hypothetical protein
MSTKVTVYRFKRIIGGRVISPRNMLGTVEAILSLGDGEVDIGSARIVDAKLLEAGFLFEDTATNFIPIDEPTRTGIED